MFKLHIFLKFIQKYFRWLVLSFFAIFLISPSVIPLEKILLLADIIWREITLSRGCRVRSLIRKADCHRRLCYRSKIPNPPRFAALTRSYYTTLSSLIFSKIHPYLHNRNSKGWKMVWGIEWNGLPRAHVDVTMSAFYSLAAALFCISPVFFRHSHFY